MRSEPFVERLVLNFLKSIWVDSAPIRDLISMNSAKYLNKLVSIEKGNKNNLEASDFT